MRPEDFSHTVRIPGLRPAGAGDAGSGEPAQLVVLRGSERGRIVAVHGPELRIGRRLDNNLVLLSAAVSKYHARLEEDGGETKLSDVGSTNGTFLNGEKLAPGERRALRHGDAIEVGDHLLLFCRSSELRHLGDLSAIRFDEARVRQEVDDLLHDFRPPR